VSRKGPVYFINQMNYDEVEDRNLALSILEKLGLVLLAPLLPTDEILARLTVQQLKSVFPTVHAETPKARLIESILNSESDSSILFEIKRSSPWFCLANPDTLELFLLLFFGNRVTDLSAFVVRDLGIVEYESYSLKRTDRQFANRDELDKYLNWISLSDALHEKETVDTIEKADEYIEALSEVQDNRTIERYRCRTLNNLGNVLEREKRLRLAIRAYRQSTRHPARERVVRILHRQGKRTTASRLQEKIVENPWTKEEEYFANRFPSRRGQPENIRVDKKEIQELPSLPIEEFTLRFLESEGAVGWHLENTLPLTMFGLAYWEWIFASVPGAFTNPFQPAPRDLFWPEFVEVRQHQLEDPLNSEESLIARVLRTARTKRGKANRLVSWDLFPDERLEQIVHTLGESSLMRLIGSVKSDISQFKAGFPDLTVIFPDGSFEFIEVKAPGDQIQRNQRIWLDELAKAQLPARVIRFVLNN
ncbi:MAG: VRR-NUC domain-containing protein, partial [Gammaproteobacteria bacterium]|nr:VRR-NUC domain-containing protein [Gammaproteobacteria bacterium]